MDFTPFVTVSQTVERLTLVTPQGLSREVKLALVAAGYTVTLTEWGGGVPGPARITAERVVASSSAAGAGPA